MRDDLMHTVGVVDEQLLQTRADAEALASLIAGEGHMGMAGVHEDGGQWFVEVIYPNGGHQYMLSPQEYTQWRERYATQREAGGDA